MKNIYTLLFIGLLSFSSLINAQTNVSGIINTNTTWTQANSPYIVTGNILVQTGSTLTIEPGVVVKVNLGLYIRIDGSLNCVGTINNFIIFESNIGNPQRGDWSGINIRPSGGGLIDSGQNYISGSQFKFTKIKHANNGLYLFNTGIYVDNCEFIDNNNGIELRNTNGVVIKSSTFFDNNSGIYTEYETFLPNDVSNNIINTYIKNNVFNENGNGIDLNLNQRSFENLVINKNRFTNNNIGIDFSGGGYGCKVTSADIDNNIFNNNSIGLQVGQIYSYGGISDEPQGSSTFKVVKNTFVNNPIYWNYGAGVLGVTSKIKNNIIYNPSSGVNPSNLNNGIYFTGGTTKNDTISNNFIYSNRESISNQDLYLYNNLNNKVFLNNTIIGQPKFSNQMVTIFGLGNVFKYNNFKVFSNKFTIKNNGSSLINTENNYWNTIIESEIQNAIFDFNDNFDLGVVDYTPFLNSPNILAPISPPINVVKTISGNDVVLTWNANLESDLSGYKLYYGNPTGYSYDNVIDLGNVTSYTIANGNLSNEYAITAYDNLANSIDDQVEGNESWYSIANPLPELPTNIVVDVAPRKSKLSWTLSSSNNVTGYKIFKGTSPNPTTLLTTVSNSTVSYTDTGLTNGTTYFYSIKSVDSNELESISSPDLSSTPANTWYVATTGGIDGFGSSNSPLNAIQTAIDASVSGEIVQVGNGTYTENIIYNGKNITVTSLFNTSQNEADITNTIIDGGANGLPVVRFHNNETNAAKLIGFTVQNGLTATNEWAAGVNIQNGAPELLNLKIKNNTGMESFAGIRVVSPGNGNNVLIKNCDIFNNSGIAIYSLTDIQSGSLKIVNCKIHHNTAQYTSSIVIHNQQNPEIPVENTLIYQNTAPNVVQGSGLVFLNCTIVNNNVADQTTPKLALTGQSGIFNSIIGTNHIITNQGNLKISKSLIKDGQSSILGNILPIWLTYSNNISSNPMFVNEAQHNYKLSDYSPAIGFGAAVNTINTFNYLAPTTDIEGNLRPNPAGSNPDLGAYENSFATTQHNTIIYVASNGNDTGSVGLETAPFATIQAAINYAINGDQILVKPGTYTGTFSVTNSISISSTDGYQQTNLVVLGMDQSVFDINGGDFSNLINVNITGFKISTNTPNITQTGISVSVGAFAKVEKCWFENISKSFGTYYGFYDVINSVFKNVEYVAHHDAGYTTNDRLSRIINCTIINANKITMAQSQYYHKIYNTIITRDNQSLESYFTSGVFPYLEKVLIDSNPNTQPGSVFTSISSIDDVYFTDILNNDYTLKNYSPAIGYGGALSNVIDDLDNNPRPTLSFPDLGAYENSLNTRSNAPPRINQVADITIDEDAVQQTINLSGISDGDLFATQNLTLSHTNSNAALFSDFTINHSASAATGTLVFTPAPNAFGTANITITVLDSGTITNGGINSKTISFTITINPINDAPVAIDDSILVNEGATITTVTNNATTLTNNDTDVDNVSLTAIIVTQPTNGSLTLNSNGTFSYTHNGSETITDSFTYKANDGALDSNIATVTITITPVNDAPVANDDSISVNEGATVTELSNNQTSVLNNDTDAESNTLTVSVVTPPTNGTLTLNSNGTFSYTHNDTETTTDSFTYKVNDGELDSNITTVNITVIPLNDNGPTDILVSNFSLNENIPSSTIGEFSVIDLDLPTDTHTYELVSGTGDTNNSSFTINGTNLLNNVAFDYETNQTLSIRVKVTDANAVSFEKIFTINVVNVNDISITHTKTDSYCAGSAGNGTITIDSVNQIIGTPTYSWTATNGGEIPPGQVNNQNLTNLPSGTYTVNITDSFFTYTESFTIALIPQYSDLSICYVSSDDTQVTKNRIYLNNQGNYNAAFYEILKESSVSNVYTSIGTILPNQNSFLDDMSNNTAQEYRYKVRLLDNCGNTSSNSTLHKTILLQSSIAVNNAVNLNWTAYEGTTIPSYIIYRKINQGAFQQIATISSSSTTYNDQTADVSQNSYEYYVAVGVSNCNISSRNIDTLTEIKSNRAILGNLLSSNDFNLTNQIMVYPNPTTNLLNIKLNDGNDFISGELFNYLGQKVMDITSIQISLEQLPSSSYIIKIITTQGQANKTFIKN